MQDIWRDGEVVLDWKDAEVCQCQRRETYRAVITGMVSACWTCMGKLFISVIYERLQHIAEDIFPESQCGFQKG